MKPEYTLAPVTLRDHLDAETVGDRSPCEGETDEMRAYREQQDTLLRTQLKRLPYSNYAIWRELSPARRRLLLDYAVTQAKELEERVAFMSRNLIVGDLRRG